MDTPEATIEETPPPHECPDAVCVVPYHSGLLLTVVLVAVFCLGCCCGGS